MVEQRFTTEASTEEPWADRPAQPKIIYFYFKKLGTKLMLGTK